MSLLDSPATLSRPSRVKYTWCSSSNASTSSGVSPVNDALYGRLPMTFSIAWTNFQLEWLFYK